MVEIILNGERVALDVPDDMPLLWAIREAAGLTGTKFGCGIGACGACTVHFNGQAVRSCLLPVGRIAGANVTTIEGLAANGELDVVQRAWIEAQVPQCGYCQSGMIMAVKALLARTPRPSDTEIDSAITNICRCGTYERIRRAVHAIAAHAEATSPAATPAEATHG